MMGEMISKSLRSRFDWPRLTNNQTVDSKKQLPQRRDSKDLENGRRFPPLIPKHQDNHRLRRNEKKTEDWSADPHHQVSGAQIVSRKALRIVLDSAEGGDSDAAGRGTELAHRVA